MPYVYLRLQVCDCVCHGKNRRYIVLILQRCCITLGIFHPLLIGWVIFVVEKETVRMNTVWKIPHTHILSCYLQLGLLLDKNQQRNRVSALCKHILNMLC